MTMRVAVLHNEVTAEASEADRDVLVQVEAVSQALERLGHETIPLAATLDLDHVRRRLLNLQPDAVFNLVESLAGSDWLMFLATGLLDVLRIPYSGSRTESLLFSNQKLLAKQRLQQAALPTPAWFSTDAFSPGFAGSSSDNGLEGGARYVLKSVSQHASAGLDDECVVEPDDADVLQERLEQHARRLACPCFAEEYIDGREFNISLLASPDGTELLPPAEIDFSGFPPQKPRIVGYRAKWNEDSFEYRCTPRRFDFPPSDKMLLDELRTLSRACWGLFGLNGYARVDFRVDRANRPWILEVNANPCLSSDAGFTAALGHAGIAFDESVARILDDVPGLAGIDVRRVRQQPKPAVEA